MICVCVLNSSSDSHSDDMHMQLLHAHSVPACTRSGSPHNVLHSSSYCQLLGAWLCPPPLDPPLLPDQYPRRCILGPVPVLNVRTFLVPILKVCTFFWTNINIVHKHTLGLLVLTQPGKDNVVQLQQLATKYYCNNIIRAWVETVCNMIMLNVIETVCITVQQNTIMRSQMQVNSISENSIVVHCMGKTFLAVLP